MELQSSQRFPVTLSKTSRKPDSPDRGGEGGVKAHWASDSTFETVRVT